MRMQNSTYHHVLRTSALTLALVLVFVSGLVTPVTKQLSQQTSAYLANTVGVYAGVEATELSQLTAELTEQKRALEERERAVQEREIAVNVGAADAGGGDMSTYILSVILFILLVLIILNYGLDYARAQQGRATGEATPA